MGAAAAPRGGHCSARHLLARDSGFPGSNPILLCLRAVVFRNSFELFSGSRSLTGTRSWCFGCAALAGALKADPPPGAATAPISPFQRLSINGVAARKNFVWRLRNLMHGGTK